jgi:hypothetical protein
VSELLKDINKILCGVITTEAGTVQIDSSLVRPRFEKQITIFAEKWEVFNKANKAKRKKEDLYETKKDKPPKKGLEWDDEKDGYLPRPKDVKLPPDPTNWELKDNLPIAYATLTTIHDLSEKVPKKRIHVDIWDEWLFARMIGRMEESYVVGSSDEEKTKKAFGIVKDDLRTQRYQGGEPGGKPSLDDDKTNKGKAYIKKERSCWIFVFNGETAKVEFQRGKELKGLDLIEFLLKHQGEEYGCLELLQAVRQREKGETESERIYTATDIKEIKKAIKGLEGRCNLSRDAVEKEKLEQEIKDAEAILYRDRNCKGKSRKFSEKYTKSVSRNIETVLKKIAPQNVELRNHLNAFLNRGGICCYKPDKKVFWEIS